MNRRFLSPTVVVFLLAIILCGLFTAQAETINLSLDRAVAIAMDNSYRIKQLKLGIERSRQWLRAERAGLKSRVYMNVKAPEFSAVSDYKWDSVLGKDVIVKQTTQMWWMNLSIRQPVVLFGYPTNGYLSLNNRIYRYNQLDDGLWESNYYNRYFLQFEQPFFQPNRLKNDLEKAELRLQENELEFLDDQVRLIDDIADDYYGLFRYSYNDIINARYIENLHRLNAISDCQGKDNGAKSIDCIQIQIELNNAREKKAQNLSDLRLESTRMKQRLRLDDLDSLIILPEVDITEISIDLDKAVDYALSLRPRMRLLEINKRQQEIDLTNVKGWNSFRMNLEMTYGLEKQDEHVQQLWNEYDNSYSVTLNAYIPIWDWGQRQARIDAQKITIQRTELYIEQTRNTIESEIRNALQNLEEYQKRVSNMQSNLEMAEEITSISIEQYANGEISLQDLLQTINRQRETDMNFLEAYLGYRKSLLELMTDTYYDYENDVELLAKFQADN